MEIKHNAMEGDFPAVENDELFFMLRHASENYNLSQARNRLLQISK